MIRRMVVSAAAVLLGLAGCRDRVDKPVAPPAPEAHAAPVAPVAPADAPSSAKPDATPAVAAAIPGAPAYAALYPGAELDGHPTIGGGEAGAGGLVTFRTKATPDEVVAFYKVRAEDAGMRSVMGMNQGDARAYGAADGGNDGPRLQVVAAPGDGAYTSVQLTWSEGQ